MQQRASETEEGKRTFRIARETSLQIQNASDRAESLLGLAIVCVQLFKDEDALAILRDARLAATNIEYDDIKDRILARIEGLAEWISEERKRQVAPIALKAEPESLLRALLQRFGALPAIYHHDNYEEVQRYVKHLITPSAYYLDTAYQICVLLAWIYPEEATEIAANVLKFGRSSPLSID